MKAGGAKPPEATVHVLCSINLMIDEVERKGRSHPTLRICIIPYRAHERRSRGRGLRYLNMMQRRMCLKANPNQGEISMCESDACDVAFFVLCRGRQHSLKDDNGHITVVDIEQF